MPAATLACAALLATTTASPPRGYDIIPYWDQPAYRVYAYQPLIAPGLRSCAPRHTGYGYDAYACSPYAPYPYAAPSYGGIYYYYRRPAVHTVYGEISTLPPPRSYAEVTGTDSKGQAEADGWRFLADGDARHAMASFIEAAKESEDAGAKIGYALAAAELGDEETAIWAMRRAFRFDAPGTRYLPLDAELRTVIDDHRRYFEYDSECLAADAWFMVAALRLVAHEDDFVPEAIQYARNMGDRSYELRRLEREFQRVEPRYPHPAGESAMATGEEGVEGADPGDPTLAATGDGR